MATNVRVVVRRGQEVKERIIQVRMPYALYERLVKVSIAADKPMSSLLRKAVAEAMPVWEQAVKENRCALL